MELHVPRLDETLGVNSLQWSADGVLAIATYSNVVLYVPDPVALFKNHKPEFSRVHSVDLDTIPLPPGIEEHLASFSARRPVTDLSWSPSGMSGARGCLLAVLSSRGDVLVLESRGRPTQGAWKFRINIYDVLDLSSATHCISWSGPIASDRCWPKAVLALGAENSIYLLDTYDNVFDPRSDPVKVNGLPVLLRWNYPHLAVVFSDNSVSVFNDETKSIEELVSPSRFLVQDVFWVSDQLIVVQPHKVTPPVVHFESATPVFGLVSSKSSMAILTQDCHVHSPEMSFWYPLSRELTKRTKEGFETCVTGAAMHPLGNMIAILMTSWPTDDWRAPIPSQLASRLVLVMLPSNRTWSAVDGALSILWLENILGKTHHIESPENLVSGQNLEQSLWLLARSFDRERVQLWDGDDGALSRMRRQIASLVLKSAETDLSLCSTEEDKACIASYRAIIGETEEENTIKLDGSFFEEEFSFGTTNNVTEIVSTQGRCWKRCSLTLLPILDLDTRVSEDEQFTSLTSELHNSPLVGTILRAFDYCVYTGSRWYKRQLNADSA